MINILHLLWIVPLTGCISAAVMALLKVAGDRDECEHLRNVIDRQREYIMHLEHEGQDPMTRKPCPDDHCPYDECGIYHTGTCYMAEEDDL